MLKYIVQVDCWIDHDFYKKGAEISMTAAQAKYEGHKIKLVVRDEKQVTKIDIPSGRTRFEEKRDRLNARNERTDGPGSQ